MLRTLSILAVAVLCAMQGAAQSDAPKPETHVKTDRERAGLVGPVKSVETEITYPARDGAPEVKFTTITFFDPFGRETEERRKNGDHEQSVLTKFYDDAGRLVKTVFQTDSGPKQETSYKYDDKGRLIALEPAGVKTDSIAYDDSGRRKRTTTFTTNMPSGVAVGSQWEDSQLPFPSPPGGKMVTAYDELDRPTGAELFNEHGTLVGRIFRTVDSAGRPLEDRYSTANPNGIDLPPELTKQMNPAQQKAISAWMGITMGFSSVTYRYDAKGRLTEKHIHSFAFDDTTTYRYNEKGDIADEVHKMVSGAAEMSGGEVDDQGNIRFQPAGDSSQGKAAEDVLSTTMRHEYQYDSFGNWTEHKIESRSQTTALSVVSQIFRRKITYY